VQPVSDQVKTGGGIMIQPEVTPAIDTSDAGLLRQMADGNPAALDVLYARYGSGIFGFLMARLGDRALAEEVLQDVMLAAWRSAAGFRGESRVLTWLLTIARNRAINATRRRRPILVPFHDALPASQCEVLTLVFYHQLTAPEVAAVLGIAVGTVKSRLHRAKHNLRRVLQREEST
jgi:DNA-directed RNA polymerase specialized sigma24 family protein